MNHSLKQGFILIFIFLILLFTLVTIDTYALFETNASGEKNMSIGKWKIFLNHNDVSTTKTITLSDFTYNNGTHTEDGYFAPGSSASFDIIIDASRTDVSVEYTLDIDDSQITEYPNMYFSIVNTKTNEEIESNTYTGVIGLNETDRTVTIRISIVWEDNLEYDESDTSLIGTELAFVIDANFKQYVGE